MLDLIPQCVSTGVAGDCSTMGTVLAALAVDMSKIWWVYVCFLIALILYLVFGPGVSEKQFLYRKRLLLELGLKILERSDGVFLDGPDEVVREYRDLIRRHRIHVWTLRCFAGVAAILYALYLGIF